MIIRHATMNDADDLFRWRNDSVTRAAFRSTSYVQREDHDQWMLRNVKYGATEHIVLIGLNEGGQKVGVLRFDSGEDALQYDVSITIASSVRGRGWGLALLETGCMCMSDYTLNADIKTQNLPSRRVFEAAGFKRAGATEKGFVRYRRVAQ